MFGVLTYRNASEQYSDLKIAIGFRNSHNKEFSAGVTVGSSVIVCDNLMFNGDLTVMRCHQGENMHEDLESQIVTAIYKSQHRFDELTGDMKKMKQVPMRRPKKFKYLDILTREGVLSPTQFSKAYREIWKPGLQKQPAL